MNIMLSGISQREKNTVYHLYVEYKKYNKLGFAHNSVFKESACNAGDPSLIPGSGRSLRERNGKPLWYSCLGNLKDRRVW